MVTCSGLLQKCEILYVCLYTHKFELIPLLYIDTSGTVLASFGNFLKFFINEIKKINFSQYPAIAIAQKL